MTDSPETGDAMARDGGVTVRPVTADDRDDWLRMRVALWPEGSEAEHREEVGRFFAGGFPREPWEVLLAEGPGGSAAGFAELSIRPYAEGCSSGRVAYLEGWYVAPAARRSGVGRALVRAAEAWGRARGCNELASDTHPENDVGAAAHRALGFEDAGLVRCFRKPL